MNEENIRESIESLKENADRVLKESSERPKGAWDHVKPALSLLFVMAVCFGWMLLMLLIISFVALSYIHMTFQSMLVASFLTAIAGGVIFLVSKNHRHKQ